MFNLGQKYIQFPKCRVLLGVLDGLQISEVNNNNECKIPPSAECLLTQRSRSDFSQGDVKNEAETPFLNKI
jgi:hypothetical protein